MWDAMDHPVAVLAMYPLIAFAGLYTPQKYRLLPFAVAFYLFWRAIGYIEYKAGLAHFFFLPGYFDWYVGDMVSKAVTILIMHMGVILILEKQKPPPASGSWAERVVTAYKDMTNLRRIGTSMVAPQVPVLADDNGNEKKQQVFAAAEGKDFSQNSFKGRVGVLHREPRLRFLARRACLAVALVVAEFFVKPVLWGILIDASYEDFEPDKVSFFRRLPGMPVAQVLRECLVRGHVVFEAFWSAYAVYTAGYAFFSVLCVGVGLDEPHEWPPLFGDVRESYSMRRFWVKYFDRLIYRTLKGCALLIARLVGIARREGETDGTLKGYVLYVLRLLGVVDKREGDDEGDGWRMGRGRGEGEPWRRWLVNGIVFAVSAWFHAHTSWWTGWRCAYWEEVWWWMMNYVAIVAEILFQEAAKKWAPRTYRKADKGWIGKAVGFAWVFLFLFWSLPKYMYPNYICNPAVERQKAGLAVY